MKIFNIVTLALIIMQIQLDAVVKTFVNNSSKDILVRIYDNKNNITGLLLAPGAIQDAFIPCNSIDKISVMDHKHINKTLVSMTHNELRKETSAINDNMIFIINKNHSINMYKGSTSRDEALCQINESFVQQAKIPTIELSIHTIKNDKPWTIQKVMYNIKHKTSFLGSIESLFA
ncbi:MAG: hypothetical protein Q8Q60_04825 [Candidatus Chromulinivorax sp.]|nr:hypothetical protein [Candidatus Chromulinivorax sp.]